VFSLHIHTHMCLCRPAV